MPKSSLWGSRSLNQKGRELLKCIQQHNLFHVSTGEATYWPSDPNKYPDVIYLKLKIFFHSIIHIRESMRCVEECI